MAIKNTMIYIDLETALFSVADEQFVVKMAANAQEACALIEQGSTTS